jgi:hypothetical protein
MIRSSTGILLISFLICIHCSVWLYTFLASISQTHFPTVAAAQSVTDDDAIVSDDGAYSNIQKYGDNNQHSNNLGYTLVVWVIPSAIVSPLISHQSVGRCFSDSVSLP